MIAHFPFPAAVERTEQIQNRRYWASESVDTQILVDEAVSAVGFRPEVVLHWPWIRSAVAAEVVLGPYIRSCRTCL